MADKQATCPQCGKRFTPWRAKKFCSERCRKRAENARGGRIKSDDGTVVADSDKTAKRLQQMQAWDTPSRGDGATLVADSPKIETSPQQTQRVTNPFRGDEGFIWTACNEVTRKLTRAGSPDAIGYAMLIDGHGWFGRIGKDFSFGPTTMSRAMKAVEARLMGQMFDKLEGENSWRGTCWKMLSGF